jgi:ribosomal protein S18 acetylase RimI-like enzyme
MMATFSVRPATADDAAAVASVLQVIVSERVHSAIDRAWSVEEERAYLESLSSREVVHVAIDRNVGVVGLQVLDRWSPSLDSMAHVGQVGTFVLPTYRRRGLGHTLWAATVTFARSAGYRKLIIQVRGTNASAQAFYRSIGFLECGRLVRQVVIDGVEEDELLMELLL